MASTKKPTKASPKASPRNIVPMIAPHEMAAFAPAAAAHLSYHGGPPDQG